MFTDNKVEKLKCFVAFFGTQDDNTSLFCLASITEVLKEVSEVEDYFELFTREFIDLLYKFIISQNTSECTYTSVDLLIMLTYVNDNLSEYLLERKMEEYLTYSINSETPYEVKNNCLILLSNMMYAKNKPEFLAENVYLQLEPFFQAVIANPTDYVLFILQNTFRLLKMLLEQMHEENLKKQNSSLFENILKAVDSTSKFDTEVLESNLQLILVVAKLPAFSEFFAESDILGSLCNLITANYGLRNLMLVLTIFEYLFDEDYLKEVIR